MAVPILDELMDPTSPEALLQTLKALKNEIIGHSQRKELWIRRGVVSRLQKLLNTYQTNSKQRQRGETRNDDTGGIRSLEEAIQLEVITIIGSLAHGGVGFICLPNRKADRTFDRRASFHHTSSDWTDL